MHIDMFRESICSSTGMANKSHGLCFCAVVPVQEGIWLLSLLTPSTREHGSPVLAGQAGCTPTLCASGSWGVHGMGMQLVFVPRQSSGPWRVSSPFPCSVASFSAEQIALIISHQGVVFLVVCFRCLPPPSWQG